MRAAADLNHFPATVFILAILIIIEMIISAWFRLDIFNNPADEAYEIGIIDLFLTKTFIDVQR